MQISIDSFVVALLMALSPEPEPGAMADRMVDGALTPAPEQRQQQLNVLVQEAAACGYFVDPEARRKCVVRTSRIVQSGAIEPGASFPETVIWLAPLEPRMPSSWGPGGPR